MLGLCFAMCVSISLVPPESQMPTPWSRYAQSDATFVGAVPPACETFWLCALLCCVRTRGRCLAAQGLCTLRWC